LSEVRLRANQHHSHARDGANSGRDATGSETAANLRLLRGDVVATKSGPGAGIEVAEVEVVEPAAGADDVGEVVEVVRRSDHVVEEFFQFNTQTRATRPTTKG